MKRPMKIAMMVRSYIPMPRPHDMIYAPIDLAVAMAKGLGKKGHQVTLFAPLGTEVHGENVTVESCNLRPLVESQDEFASLLQDSDKLSNGQVHLWDQYMACCMYERAAAGEFDLLYFHHPETALGLAREFPKVKTIIQLHDPIRDWRKELYELYAGDNVSFVSISKNQRRDAPDLNYLATVYNGTDTDLFEFDDEPDDFLFFSGRLNPVKGVKEAIQVARDSGHRLLIAGPPDLGHEYYFEQHIKPELDENILYIGRMDQEQLKTYYQKAKALLTPVQWEEPFGLTTIEAMASGTPVISLNRGAAPEIIVDGKTGFVVNSISEMVEAVDKVATIKRKDCRLHVERNFSYQTMVDEYEKVLLSHIGKDDARPPLLTADSALRRGLEELKKLVS